MNTLTYINLKNRGLIFDYDNKRDWSKYSPIENLYLNSISMKQKYIEKINLDEFIHNTADEVSSEILNNIYSKNKK